MTAERRKIGPTETQYRRWIRSLGTLTDQQTAQAEVLYVLASQVDKCLIADATSAVASISRELRQAATGFREMQRLPAETQEDAKTGGIDEVARAREKRIAGGTS